MRIPKISKVFVRLVLSSNVKGVQHPWHHDGTHPTLSLVLFLLQASYFKAFNCCVASYALLQSLAGSVSVRYVERRSDPLHPSCERPWHHTAWYLPKSEHVAKSDKINNLPHAHTPIAHVSLCGNWYGLKPK